MDSIYSPAFRLLCGNDGDFFSHHESGIESRHRTDRLNPCLFQCLLWLPVIFPKMLSYRTAQSCRDCSSNLPCSCRARYRKSSMCAFFHPERGKFHIVIAFEQVFVRERFKMNFVNCIGCVGISSRRKISRFV